MFGNALAGQREMATELVESLAVVLVELIEEGAPVWVGQGSKDFVHRGRNMQPNGCILVPAAQIPKQNATTMVFAANLSPQEPITSSGKASVSQSR